MATDYQDALAMLGLHRHPDYWKSDDELAPMPTRTTTRSGRQVASPRDREAEATARLAAGAERNQARRAAAAAGLPQPEHGPSNQLDVLTTVGVIGASQR